VEVRTRRINVHLPPLDKFALDHLSATPVAAMVAAADPEAREKIGATVMTALRRYADNEGVTYPEEAYVVTAEVS
jgi:hypothetical protein